MDTKCRLSFKFVGKQLARMSRPKLDKVQSESTALKYVLKFFYDNCLEDLKKQPKRIGKTNFLLTLTASSLLKYFNI